MSDTIYLLDEITYLSDFDVEFCRIAEKYTYDNQYSKVKIIITGSQAYSIRWFAMTAFATDAYYIRTSFIDFEEWLLYRNKISTYNQPYNCNENDYLDYIKIQLNF